MAYGWEAYNNALANIGKNIANTIDYNKEFDLLQKEKQDKLAEQENNSKILRLLGSDGIPTPQGFQQFTPQDKVGLITRLKGLPTESMYNDIQDVLKPQKIEKNIIYQKDKAYEQLPTGQLIPKPEFNLPEKPQPKIEFKNKQEFNNKLGKWQTWKEKYIDGVLADSSTPTFHDVKEKKDGVTKLTTQTRNSLNSDWQKIVNDASELNSGIKAKAVWQDGEWVMKDTKGNDINIADYRLQKENELKGLTANLAEKSKMVMSQNARDLLDEMFNTNQSSDTYWKIVKDAYKEGHIDAGDVEAFTSHYRATYGKEPR